MPSQNKDSGTRSRWRLTIALAVLGGSIGLLVSVAAGPEAHAATSPVLTMTTTGMATDAQLQTGTPTRKQIRKKARRVGRATRTRHLEGELGTTAGAKGIRKRGHRILVRKWRAKYGVAATRTANQTAPVVARGWWRDTWDRKECLLVMNTAYFGRPHEAARMCMRPRWAKADYGKLAESQFLCGGAAIYTAGTAAFAKAGPHATVVTGASTFMLCAARETWKWIQFQRYRIGAPNPV